MFEAARLMQLVSESWIILLGQNENMLEHCCGLKIIYDKIKTKIHEINTMAFVCHVKHSCAVPFLIGMLWFAPMLLSSPVWLLSGRRKLFKFLSNSSRLPWLTRNSALDNSSSDCWSEPSEGAVWNGWLWGIGEQGILYMKGCGERRIGDLEMGSSNSLKLWAK